MRLPWWSKPKEKAKVISPEDVKAIRAAETEAALTRNKALCDEFVGKALNSLYNGHFVHDEKGLLVEVEGSKNVGYSLEVAIGRELHDRGYDTTTTTYGYHKLQVYFK